MIRYQVRMEAEIKGRTLHGHAAVFGEQTFKTESRRAEMIASTAFDRVLKDPATDVVGLLNHDPNMILGRQQSGTLRIGTDSEGLAFELDLPDTTVGNDVRELAERGDLSGASFGFLPDAFEFRGGAQVHTSVKFLRDIGPVTFPAYEGADTAVRSEFEQEPNHRSQLIRVRHRIRRG